MLSMLAFQNLRKRDNDQKCLKISFIKHTILHNKKAFLIANNKANRYNYVLQRNLNKWRNGRGTGELGQMLWRNEAC